MDVYNILLATLKWYKLKSLLQSCKVSYKALRIKKKLQSLAFWPIFALLCMGLLHEFCELRTEGWLRKPRLLLWTFHNCVIFLLSWPSRDNCIRENSLPSEHGAKSSTAPAPSSKVMHTMKHDQSYIILAAAEVSHYIDKRYSLLRFYFT